MAPDGELRFGKETSWLVLMTWQTDKNSARRKIISHHSAHSKKYFLRLLEVEAISFVYRECHFNVRMIWFEVGIMLCEMKKHFRSTLRRHSVRVMHGALLIVMSYIVGWAQSFVTVD